MCVCVCACACSVYIVACQVSLSMEFSRQESWSGLPFPSPGDLPDPGIEPAYLASSALAGRFFTTSTTWEAPFSHYASIKRHSPYSDGAVCLVKTSRCNTHMAVLEKMYSQGLREEESIHFCLGMGQDKLEKNEVIFPFL